MFINIWEGLNLWKRVSKQEKEQKIRSENGILKGKLETGPKFKNKVWNLRIWNRTVVSFESRNIDKSIKKFNRVYKFVYKFVYKWFVRCEKRELVTKSEISPMWVLIYGLKDPISHHSISKVYI